MVDFAVLIPVYEALRETQTCLGGLDTQYPDRHLILVDDCSGPDTASWLRVYAEKIPRTDLVPRSTRGWFTRAINTGLRFWLETCNEPWLLALNSDCIIGNKPLEEMMTCWEMAEGNGYPVGLVGSCGPTPQSHPRLGVIHYPGYITGHALLLSREVMVKEKLRFPQDTSDTGGQWNESADSLVHVASDRVLSWILDGRGYQTVASYWAEVGHHGGASWHHNMMSIPKAAGLQV